MSKMGLFKIVTIIVVSIFVFSNTVLAQESKTTLYFNSYYQKDVESNEVTKFYQIGSGLAMRKGGSLYFIHTDHLSSTTIITDSNGNEVGRISYYPYGSTLETSGNIPAERKFTGQIKDDSTDLYYYVARYYNPETGNFISADTVGKGNRYVYAENNPLMFTDPTGHMVIADGTATRESWINRMFDFFSRLEPEFLRTRREAQMAKFSRLGKLEAQIYEFRKNKQPIPPELMEEYYQLEFEVTMPLVMMASTPIRTMPPPPKLIIETAEKATIPKRLNPRYFTSEGSATQILRTIRDRIVESFHKLYPGEEIKGIYVIGSQSYGGWKSTSDLDILIHSSSTKPKWEEGFALIRELNPGIPGSTFQEMANLINANPSLKAQFIDVFIWDMPPLPSDVGGTTFFELMTETWVKIR